MDYTKFFSKATFRRKTNLIRVFAEAYLNKSDNAISFAGGMPNSETFPFKHISVITKNGLNQQIKDKDLEASLQYGPSQGYLPLIKMFREIQRYWHSPKRDDWDILFSSGCQDGCTKIFELFIDEGQPIMVQTPTFTATLGAISALNPDFIGISQDADGIIPEEIDKVCKERLSNNMPLPKLLYVNPTGSNPTGSTLPEIRRKEVYALAQKYNFLILEDDAYYFVHFLDKRPTSFFSLDTDGRVLRLDSFSKCVSPGLRVGLVTAHKTLIAKLILYVENSTIHASCLSQMFLYKLFESWSLDELDEHMKYIQNFYRTRRDTMLLGLTKHLDGLAEWSVPKGGLFVWIKVTEVDEILDLVMNKCIPNGIFILPGNAFNYDREIPDQHLRLSYSYATPEEIDKGLFILGKILREELSKKTNLH